MKESQILALKSATAYYMQSYNIDGVTVYVTFLIFDSQQELVKAFPDVLAQGTRGHNTDVCHREFSGGGFLPATKGSASYQIVQDYLFKDASAEDHPSPTRRRLSHAKEEIYGITGQTGPCDVYYYSYATQLLYNTVTGECVKSTQSGFMSHITSVDYVGGRWKLTYKRVNLNLTWYHEPEEDTESILRRLVDEQTTRTMNLSKFVVNGSVLNPIFTNYDMGDTSYIRFKTGPYLGLMEHVKAQAFINACDEFPRQCDNQIANIADVLSLLKVALDPSEVVRSIYDALNKGLGSMWMWWRYAYTTSMSDIYQAIDYQYRQKMSIWMSHRYDGFATETISNEYGFENDVHCHCGFIARIKPSKLYSNTQWTNGLEVNPYIIWDMIPLSFVADWFLGVGDKLQLKSDLRHYLSDYSITELFFTTDYTAVVEERTQLKARTYTRDYTGIPSILRGSFIPNGRDGSAVTQIKRGVDALSLVQVI